MPFAPVDTTPAAPERLIVSAWGLPKEGKSTFALSFPEPIYLFNFDHGFKEIVHKFPGKEIYASDFLLPELFDLSTYGPLTDRFRKEWAEACAAAGPRGGTVVLDTASQVWQMLGQTIRERAEAERAAKSGRQAKEMRTDWGPANLMMGSLLRRPYQTPGLNAVYIQRAKERYDERGQATGTYQLHGFSETEALVQVVLNILSRQGNVLGRIDRCRFDKGLEGLEIANPTYESLLGLLTPDEATV